jgi:hypothetical protein
MRSLIHLTLAAFFVLSAANAQEPDTKKEDPAKRNEISDILDSMGYPELQVVPRASERLAIEAKAEDTSAAFTHWPVQFAGLTTAIVGFMAKGNSRTDLTTKEQSDTTTIASVTQVVGLGWIVGGAIMGLQRPYRSGERAISKYPGKDDRSTLMRERLAEETLEKPARTARVMENFAVITDVTMNIACAWHANETGKISAGIGVLLSFLPYVFEDHAIDVYERQMEYKKKIYTPIKSVSFSYDPNHKTLTPLAGLTWNF